MQLAEALRDFDPKLLTFSEGRRLLAMHDPLLFAAIYLPHKIKLEDGSVSVSPFHLDIVDYGKSWLDKAPGLKEHRDAFIAPRSSGKSTWIFHLIPLWAGAFGHKKYVICFSDSINQAEAWLGNFTMELASNELLRKDFPEFCDTFKLTKGGKAFRDNRHTTQRGNGFIFQAKGADSAVLGTNIGGLRPDVILFDDIEPSESNYSEASMRARLSELQTTHLYLNLSAIVAIVGTTTMPDSIIDQIRRVGELRADFDGDPADFRDSVDPALRWVLDENIKSRYWPAILDQDGQEVSLWPERWSMDYLDGERGTRAFALNMMNRPISKDGGYWDESDIALDEPESYNSLTVLAVDPAVVTKRTNDDTGLAVLQRGSDGVVYVKHAEGVKLASEALAEHVATLVERFGVDLVYVESNQGGDLWKQVFSGLPCRLKLHRHNSGSSKEHRAGQAFDLYKKGQVKHLQRFPRLEEQMLSFPRVRHDDILDAVVNGVLLFKNNAGSKVTATQRKYQEV